VKFGGRATEDPLRDAIALQDNPGYLLLDRYRSDVRRELI
jgi:hypothetical protein